MNVEVAPRDLCTLPPFDSLDEAEPHKEATIAYDGRASLDNYVEVGDDVEPERVEHDPEGRLEAVFNDNDFIQHDSLDELLERVREMYEMRDFLNGDAPTAVTIGPAGDIERPHPDYDHDWEVADDV